MTLTRRLMLIFLHLEIQKREPETEKKPRKGLPHSAQPPSGQRAKGKKKEKKQKLFTQGVDPHLHYKVALV